MRTGSVLPTTVIRSSSRASTSCCARRTVSSLIIIRVPYTSFAPTSREATLDGIPNYREVLGDLRPDRAHNDFSGRNSHVHANCRGAAPKTDKLRQFFIKTFNGYLLLER